MENYDYYSYYRHYAPWDNSYQDLIVKVVIEDGVTSIGAGAFYGCSSLMNITIPDSVTSIGDWAFSDCDSLTSIEIPDSVTSIGSEAFRFCYSLTSVVLPKGLTMVEPWFQSCYNLKTVYIPVNVIMIKGSAFAGTSLKTIIYCGTEAQWNNIAKVTNWDGGNNPSVQYHDYDWESSGAEMHQGICIYCDSMIESIEHSFDEGKITTPATHTTVGVKTFTCTDCGETKTEEVAAKIAEYTYGGWVTVTEATEDTEGLREKVCACGDRVTEVIPKLPKSEESTVEKSDGSITDTNEAPTVQEDDGMGVGAIVAISVGGTATAGIGGVSVWWFAIKKKRFSDLVKLVKKAPKAPPME